MVLAPCCRARLPALSCQTAVIANSLQHQLKPNANDGLVVLLDWILPGPPVGLTSTNSSRFSQPPLRRPYSCCLMKVQQDKHLIEAGISVMYLAWFESTMRNLLTLAESSDDVRTSRPRLSSTTKPIKEQDLSCIPMNLLTPGSRWES